MIFGRSFQRNALSGTLTPTPSLSTLTPTYLFVLVWSGYRRSVQRLLTEGLAKQSPLLLESPIYSVLLGQIREKPPHFSGGFSSSISVWWSLRDSNPRHPACKVCVGNTLYDTSECSNAVRRIMVYRFSHF